MTRLRRRILITIALIISLALVLGALFQFTTRRALERAEALEFRRMLVTKRGEKGAYRFFYATNRHLENQDGEIVERFGNKRGENLKFGFFES